VDPAGPPNSISWPISIVDSPSLLWLPLTAMDTGGFALLVMVNMGGNLPRSKFDVALVLTGDESDGLDDAETGRPLVCAVASDESDDCPSVSVAAKFRDVGIGGRTLILVRDESVYIELPSD